MEQDQKFSVSHLDKSQFRIDGLRPFFEYRDLGINDATHGRVLAHVIRARPGVPMKPQRHHHEVQFQMVYVLKGWIRFVYEGQGEQMFHAGDCVVQPAGIVHNELECSDDVEILEVYSPAVHETRVVEKMPEAVAAR